jgi:hypothetical protein
MANDTIQIINVETDEVIIREMTDEEQAIRNAEVAEYNAKLATETAEAEAAKLAKEAAQEKLAALGLTADDLKALGL